MPRSALSARRTRAAHKLAQHASSAHERSEQKKKKKHAQHTGGHRLSSVSAIGSSASPAPVDEDDVRVELKLRRPTRRGAGSIDVKAGGLVDGGSCSIRPRWRRHPPSGRGTGDCFAWADLRKATPSEKLGTIVEPRVHTRTQTRRAGSGPNGTAGRPGRDERESRPTTTHHFPRRPTTASSPLPQDVHDQPPPHPPAPAAGSRSSRP